MGPGDRLVAGGGVAALDGLGVILEVEVQEVRVHPTWVALNQRTRGLDRTVGKPGVVGLAIIILKTPIAKLPAARLAASALAKEDTVWLGGFGITDVRTQERSFQYKASPKRIRTLDALNAVLAAENVKAPRNSRFAMGAPGDSVGAVFRFGPGGLVVIGVNSFVRGALELGPYPGFELIRKIGPAVMSFVRLDTEKARRWLDENLLAGQ